VLRRQPNGRLTVVDLLSSAVVVLRTDGIKTLLVFKSKKKKIQIYVKAPILLCLSPNLLLEGCFTEISSLHAIFVGNGSGWICFAKIQIIKYF
jgi:hypothetical protein